jgi:antagonist of KipI
LISVIQPGSFTTVQDLGRVGYQSLGVPESGAMDQFALRCANILVGNPEYYAGIEITLFGPELEFHHDQIISITGADLGPMIDGEAVLSWSTLRVNSGQKLAFKGPSKNGIRCYVAFTGGIDGGVVKEVLGSRSTYVQGNLGGYGGRALQAGDVLHIGVSSDVVVKDKSLKEIPKYPDETTLRIVLGPQDDRFEKESIRTLSEKVYTASVNSDRMGYRLEGERLWHLGKADVISDGNVFGVIQVPADGLPIILCADRGTTGGYAKIGTVITADRSKIAQLVPGGKLGFEIISLEKALKEYEKQEDILSNLSSGLAKIQILANNVEVEVLGQDGERIAMPTNFKTMSVDVSNGLNESAVEVSFR